jgi:predicted lipoprotein with Yx(FWY)xxD motif
MKYRPFRLAIALLSGVWLLASCQSDNPGPADDVALRETTLGPVLTAYTGQTLYLFQSDVGGQSNCTGECNGTWYPFYAGEVPSLSTGLDTAFFDVLYRPDGRIQTTYRGWPLYTFRGDATPGQTRGENANGRWLVARPDYAVVWADAQLVGHDGQPYTSQYQGGFGNTQYLVDGQGRTLYIFSRDRRNTNTFTRPDLSNNATWPVFSGPITTIPSGMNAADFGTIRVGTQTQVTYKGWPLYYFGQDAGQRGATKGVSFPRPGVWPVVTAQTAAAPL